MGISSKQIGWGTESNLLWQILKQLKQLASIIFSLKAAATPKYKVFTANLYQTGSSNLLTLNGAPLTIGVSYVITDTDGDTVDFTNVGAPSNLPGTKFIATGTTPNSWGSSLLGELTYDDGAPVANVLENTLGNVWFQFASDGIYELQSLSLFTTGKTSVIMSTPIDAGDAASPGIYSISQGDSVISIYTSRLTDLNQRINYLYNTFLEVRVYN